MNQYKTTCRTLVVLAWMKLEMNPQGSMLPNSKRQSTLYIGHYWLVFMFTSFGLSQSQVTMFSMEALSATTHRNSSTPVRISMTTLTWESCMSSSCCSWFCLQSSFHMDSQCTKSQVQLCSIMEIITNWCLIFM
jgi:hypothetical protein